MVGSNASLLGIPLHARAFIERRKAKADVRIAREQKWYLVWYRREFASLPLAEPDRRFPRVPRTRIMASLHSKLEDVSYD